MSHVIFHLPVLPNHVRQQKPFYCVRLSVCEKMMYCVVFLHWNKVYSGKLCAAN